MGLKVVAVSVGVHGRFREVGEEFELTDPLEIKHVQAGKSKWLKPVKTEKKEDKKDDNLV